MKSKRGGILVPGRRAFTLIELLVAVTIAAAMAALLVSLSATALKIWDRANGRWATANAASVALDQIETDLMSAVLTRTPGVKLAANVLTGTSQSGIWVPASLFPKPNGAESLRLDEPDMAQCRFGAAGTWLRFFIGSSADNRAGIKAVAYQIVRRAQTSSAGAETSYLLFRSVVAADKTWAEGYDLGSSGYTTAAGTEGAPGNIVRPNLNQVLADHVVDFGVRFYSEQAGGLVPLYPASGGAWTNATTTYSVRAMPDAPVVSPWPDVAEVMIRVLTEEGVRQLRLRENPPAGFSSSETWWDLVERHSHVHVRRVRFTTRES